MASRELDLIRHALAVARQHGCREVEIGENGWEFHAQLDPLVAPKPAASGSPAKEDDSHRPLKATGVGYYLAAKHPLKAGAKFKKGDVVAGITALGIENDLEAPFDGEVTEMLVHEGDPLEFGQPIAMVQVGK